MTKQEEDLAIEELAVVTVEVTRMLLTVAKALNVELYQAYAIVEELFADEDFTTAVGIVIRADRFILDNPSKTPNIEQKTDTSQS